MRSNRIPLWLIGGGLIFIAYTYGLTRNPPGFYIDESAFAYNAYLISRTGAGEFGVHWPLYFQNYTPPFTTLANPVCIYLLALVNLVLPPSIWLARFLSSTAVFAAALLLGLLAFRISSRRIIGVVVAGTALLTPWLYEVGRLYFDSSFYPLALSLFLLALYSASKKESWSWIDVIKISAGLGLLTYTYTIGRLFTPLLALGLIVFAADRKRFFNVIKVWVLYAVTLIPLAVFNLTHPGALLSRFVIVSYVGKESGFLDLLGTFIGRFLQDLSLFGLLTTGDDISRHHVPGSSGSLLLTTFLLFLMGVVVVLLKRRHDPWWQFILCGTVASIVPAALTSDPFHTGRLIAYVVFVLVLSVPALEWLLETDKQAEPKNAESGSASSGGLKNLSTRQSLLAGLILATLIQATYFQVVFWRDGEDRHGAVDEGYKAVYDAAVSMSPEKIYLQDGSAPTYIHALWYATLEKRSLAQFVHLGYDERPPAHALVISSASSCTSCQIIMKRDQFALYRQLTPGGGSPDQ